MVEMRFVFALLLLPVVVMAQQFGGNPPEIKWKQVNTNGARVIFPTGLDSQANRISNVLAMLDTTTLYSIGTKMSKWNVVLQHQNTSANAYVRLAPVISEFYMVPPQNNFTNGSLRWDDNLVIHEDRHMQQFSNFNNGLTKVFSFLLGQEGQLLANGITIPNYFFEGDAVWQETLVSKQGRGRLPAFYNGLKSLWLDNKKYNWMKLRSGSLRDYTPDHYELGYPLVAYGYEQYGPRFWRKVTEDAVRFKGLFYAFNKAIEKHSGVSYRKFREAALQYFNYKMLKGVQPGSDNIQFITPLEAHNVTDYLFPQYVHDDTIIVTKQSYRELNAFYLLVNGKEQFIRVKDYVTDDYFSYNNGKVVYAAYQSDARWGNRNYSVIQLLDIYTNKQRQITSGSMYFSPDINTTGSELIAVKVNADGSNHLQRLSAATGEIIMELPNPSNYFFTQTKYIDDHEAVSAVRNPEGQMALVLVNLHTGAIENLTPFSWSVLGYPQVRNGMVYFGMTDQLNQQLPAADRVFTLRLKDRQLTRVTNNVNGIYQPAVNSTGELIFSAFTSGGYRLAKSNRTATGGEEIGPLVNVLMADSMQALSGVGAGSLCRLQDVKQNVTNYKKSFQLFNFHSARPFVSDPEYGYMLYSDNILSNFNNSISYTYNRNDLSHSLGYNTVFAGWFPYLSLGTAYTVNRNNYNSQGNLIQYNVAELNGAISLPLSIIRGKTFKYLNMGVGYNIERTFFTGASKGLYANRNLQYINSFFSFSNVSRTARQQINPRWAQTFSVTFRDAVTLYNSQKFLARSSLYFPGLIATHSLVLDGAFQKRDTMGGDLFSNTFPYSRGYQALSERQQFKLGANYHFPLFYPDWGVGNIFFIQRIRANAFYDHTRVKARLANGRFFNFNNRSTGAEIYLDMQVWNALPVSLGVRYSRLLDTDFLNRGAVNRWEIILPVNLIPD